MKLNYHQSKKEYNTLRELPSTSTHVPTPPMEGME